MYVFSYRIFDENVYHNVYMNMVEYQNELINVLIMLMNVSNKFARAKNFKEKLPPAILMQDLLSEINVFQPYDQRKHILF